MTLFLKNKLVFLLLIISYALLGTTASASLNYKFAFVNQTKKVMKVVYKPSLLSCVSILEPSTLVLPRPKSLQWDDEIIGYVNVVFKNNLFCNPKKHSAHFEIFAKNDDNSFTDLTTFTVTPKFTTTLEDNIVTRGWKLSTTFQHHSEYNPKDIVIALLPGDSDSMLSGATNRISLCDVNTKGSNCY